MIAAIDDVPVTGVDDLVRLLDASRIGRSIVCKVLRRSGTADVVLVPRAKP